MGIVAAVKAFAREFRYPGPERSGGGLLGSGGGGLRSLRWERDAYELTGEGVGAGSDLVFAALRWIATNYHSAPLLLSRRQPDGSLTPEPDHPMLLLLRRPNPDMGGHGLWWATIADLILYGNAYWLKTRGQQGGMAELWYIPYRQMEPYWQPPDYISGYIYRADGRQETARYPQDEVVHLRYGRDWEHPRYGISPLRAALSHVMTDREADDYSNAMLHNRGIAGSIIAPARGEDAYSLSRELMQNVVAEFEAQTSGARRGKPVGLTVPVDVKSMSVDPRDMDLAALRALPETRIPAILGLNAPVLAFLAGLQHATARATLDGYRAQAWQDCLIPLQNLLDEQLLYQLLPEFEDDPTTLVMSHDYSQVPELQENLLQKTQRLAISLREGAITRGEYREAFGYEVGEGDDVYLARVGASPVAREQRVDPAAAMAEARALRARLPLLKNRLTAAESAYLRRQVSDAGRRSEELATRVRGLLGELGERLQAVAAEHLREAEVLVASGNGHFAGHMPVELRQVNMAPGLLGAAAEEWGEAELGPAYAEARDGVIDDLLAALAATLGIDAGLPSDARQALLDEAAARVELLRLEETTERRARERIQAGLAAGLSLAAISEGLGRDLAAGRFTDLASRAAAIGENETLDSQRRAALAIYRQTRGVTGVRCVDGQLPTSDEICIARDGLVYSLADADTITAGEHPNGTLRWVPVLEA